MKKGEEKEFTLGPEEAYGNPDPNLYKEIPREILPKEQEPKVGMALVLETPDSNLYQVLKLNNLLLQPKQVQEPGSGTESTSSGTSGSSGSTQYDSGTPSANSGITGGSYNER